MVSDIWVDHGEFLLIYWFCFGLVDFAVGSCLESAELLKIDLQLGESVAGNIAAEGTWAGHWSRIPVGSGSGYEREGFAAIALLELAIEKSSFCSVWRGSHRIWCWIGSVGQLVTYRETDP